MKSLFAVVAFILFLLCSCKQAQQDNSFLYSRLDRLEAKVDSLARLVWDMQTLKATVPVKPKSTQKKKQVTNAVPVTPTPVRNTNSYSSSTSYSGRCLATTKRGSQCKRTARSGGYCWQHGG